MFTFVPGRLLSKNPHQNQKYPYLNVWTIGLELKYQENYEQKSYELKGKS